MATRKRRSSRSRWRYRGTMRRRGDCWRRALPSPDTPTTCTRLTRATSTLKSGTSHSQIPDKQGAFSLSKRKRPIFTARKRSLRRLYFYTCLSFYSQGGEYLGRYIPHPRAGTPPWVVHNGIRSTSGRYESYWNAFLFLLSFSQHV